MNTNLRFTKMKAFLIAFLLLPFAILSQTSVQFNLNDPTYGIAQTTNVVVVLQASSIGQSGNQILLPLTLYNVTDTNGVCTFSNVFGSTIPGQGYYRFTIQIGRNPSATIWVQSTNLGTIQASTIILGDGTSSTPGLPSWSAATSDARYGPSTNLISGFATGAQLNGASNVLAVQIVSSTNGQTSIVYTNPASLTTLQQVTNVAKLISANTNFGNISQTATNTIFNIASNLVSSQIPLSTNGFTSIVYTNPSALVTLPQVTNVVTVLAANTNFGNISQQATNAILAMIGGGTIQQYTLTNSFVTGTNLVATNAFLQTLAALFAAMQFTTQNSNSVIMTNVSQLNFASNYLASTLQGGTMTLSNLSVTGALTNSPTAGQNFSITTNISGTIIFLNATNQTFLTNGFTPLVYTNPSAVLYVSALPGLTNGFVTASITNGLATIQYVQSFFAGGPANTNQYFPGQNNSFTTNFSGSIIFINSTNQTFLTNGFSGIQFFPTNAFVATNATAALTNGLATTNYVGLNYYPTSNPSAFVNSGITNLVANTNWVLANFDTNGTALNYLQITLTNNGTQGVTNYGTWNFVNPAVFGSQSQGLLGVINIWDNRLGLYDQINGNNGFRFNNNLFFTGFLSGNAGPTLTGLVVNSNEISGQLNAGQIFGLPTTNSFISVSNGYAYSPTIQDQLAFLNNTNFQVDTNVIGIWSGGTGNGTYRQIYTLGLPTAIWTNYVNNQAAFRIIFSGGNYTLQSNGVPQYFNTTPNGQWSLAAGGATPVPLSSYGIDFHCNGVFLKGFVDSTNLTWQITNSIAQLVPIYSQGSNLFKIVAGYGISNIVSGVSNTISVNSNSIPNYWWVTSYVQAAIVGATNGGGISATTGSNIVANYGGTLYLTYVSGTGITNAINLMANTNLGNLSATGLGVITNIASAIAAGTTNVTLTTVSNMATAVADNVLMGGVLAGMTTNAVFNQTGTNAIKSIVLAYNNGPFTNVAIYAGGNYSNVLNASDETINPGGTSWPTYILNSASFGEGNLLQLGPGNSRLIDSFAFGQTNVFWSLDGSSGFMNDFILGSWNGMTNSGFTVSNSIIVGFSNNILNSSFSTLLGSQGFINQASDIFLWNDGLVPFTANHARTFIVNAANGVGINTANPNGNAMEVNGNVDASSFTINGLNISTPSALSISNLFLLGTNYISGTWFFSSNSTASGLVVTINPGGVTNYAGTYIPATNNGSYYTNANGNGMIYSTGVNPQSFEAGSYLLSSNFSKNFPAYYFQYPVGNGWFGVPGTSGATNGTVNVLYSNLVSTSVSMAINTNSSSGNALSVNGSEFVSGPRFYSTNMSAFDLPAGYCGPWVSNYDLYWITPLKTNLITLGH